MGSYECILFDMRQFIRRSDPRCRGRRCKKELIKKDYTQKQIARNIKFISKAAGLLKYVTCLVLLLGLLWCSYYLILGIMEPKMAEYANNMSELIVAVLSVISIMFAFVEFIRRKE